MIKQNGFAIDRDEILIDKMPKSDRLVPKVQDTEHLGIEGYSAFSSSEDGEGGEIGVDETTPDGRIDLNFYPLQVGPVKVPLKPDFVPYLDINKVIIIKHRRSKGLPITDLCNGVVDSNDQ